ncbi:iron complex outermembrane recepter protein [Roseateles sp. YR242]|uniref:TonB-dependent receptor n=1 Tax=Roseateles sp. YR242 TaxID=1855305 RepID=UPI0008AEF2CF|nr:TonB-dependent receptor [Roseateles sp. YR242]SEK60836.1 iron complex outermembrane recepter protein [Roseateles sp. YR242]
MSSSRFACHADPVRRSTPSSHRRRALAPTPLILSLLAALHGGAFAQTAAAAAAAAPVPASAASPADGQPDSGPAQPRQLEKVVIEASADASAKGLPKAYAGGQVARGSRIGLLGNQDIMETPFNTTAYTNELIQNTQARSVGDVLLNDPAVRVARGFGNFQESYFIRGFILNSDSVAYNGLYGLLPRQYISAELFERVEVLRGASAFLNGATPNSDGIGGSINLLPKRAPSQALSQLTVGTASGGQTYLAVDLARRFGPDNSTGIRVNAATRSGDTSVDRESVEMGMAAVALDWRSRDVRLSADIGYQDHQLKRARTNVTLSTAATASITGIPKTPDGDANWAQPWSYSKERDTFGTIRGEVDLDRLGAKDWTAWFAMGARNSAEANSLANLTLTNSTTGAGTTYRFDNTREDHVHTGEIGLRGQLRTGGIRHELVASANAFKLDKKAAYGSSPSSGVNLLQTNLYTPVDATMPALTTIANQLENPGTTGITYLRSVALADTLVALDDRLRVTLGLRHQQLDIRTYAYNTGTQSSGYSPSRTSPMAGVIYRFTPSWSAYANYIEALTQGETASATTAGANLGGITLPPYVSRQKELGLKYDGGRIGGTVALFSTAKPRAVTVYNVSFTAEGEDRHQGVEFTAFGEITRDWKLLGGFTWLDAEQRRTGAPTTEGKQVIGVPRRMLNLGTEWNVPGLEGLTLDARMVATSPVAANAINTLNVPGWTRLDAGARYTIDFRGHLMTLRARVDNVANRSYWASAGGYPGSGYLVLGTPRSVTVSASMDY